MQADAIGSERKVTSGVTTALRAGAYSELIVNDIGLGRYFESTRFGRLYTLAAAPTGVAPAAANVSPIPVTTGQPLVGIFNPLGSGQAAVIIQAGFSAVNVVTTQTASIICWNYIPSPAGITSAGGAGAVGGLLVSPAPSSMRTFVNTVPTGAPAFTFLRPLYANSQMTTAPAVAQAVTAYVTEETAGSIIVPPGAAVGLAAHAASATLYAAFMTWLECDWPL
jgi:hypothetical protein